MAVFGREVGEKIADLEMDKGVDVKEGGFLRGKVWYGYNRFGIVL